MLESILIQSGNEGLTLSAGSFIACCLSSIILGLCVAVLYMVCSDKYSKNFVVTISILPILVQVVIMMVNGNLGTGVAILGAFSLVRFRSVPGNSKEICTVFYAMAIGLATGTGYLGFAALFTVIVGVMFFVLTRANFGVKKESMKQLKVTIPENLNYIGMFDDIFAKYTLSAEIDKVKTTNLGSMFEVTYLIKMANENMEKDMIDEIRVRNGNLTVVCGRISTPVDEL